MIIHRSLIILLIGVSLLACVTNQRMAQIATPRPTRTPLPTFTVTPLPPTATAVPTETPRGDLPVDTPPQAEATPVPDSAVDTPSQAEATPVPDNSAVEPTSGAVNEVASDSRREGGSEATATPTPIATASRFRPSTDTQSNTPAGSYKIAESKAGQNCEAVLVLGRVTAADLTSPLAGVTIQVQGEGDKFRQPLFEVTDSNGAYRFILGSLSEAGRENFTVQVVGDGVSSETVNWLSHDSCSRRGAVQVMTIDWYQK